MSHLATRRKLASGLLLIAALAAALCFFLAQFVAAGRVAAHVIDVSGPARMQTQRIAYQLAMANARTLEPGWRTDAEPSIAAIVIGSEEPERVSPLAAVLREPQRYALAHEADAFFDAARALVREPSDAPAFPAIRKLRSNVLRDFHHVVESRVDLVAKRNDQLVETLVASLVLLFGAIGVVWFSLIGPAERHLRASIADVSAQSAEMQSLFDQTPDAIAIYDLSGSLVRTNRARAELIGAPAAELVGRHVSTFIGPAHRAAAMNAFERAMTGEYGTFESVLLSVAGESIDVQISVFPNVVNGVTSGFIAVSRDMRELRRAQAESCEISQRLAALCAIASGHGSDWKQQVEAALALAASQLECKWGIVGEIADEDVSVLALVGEPAGMHVGMALPLKDSLTQYIMRSDDVWCVDDLLESPWRGHNHRQGTAWRSMVAMKLRVNGVAYGTFAIASPAPRIAPLRTADFDFLKILASLLGSIIARGRQSAQLDSLAFFDALTGLPNRASVVQKLDDLIAFAAGHDASFAVHFIDLDRFKEINDRAGHAIGDEVLRELARRFAHCVRGTDTVGRLGGDEFIILQPTNTGRQGAADVAARITKAVAEPFICGGQSFRLGCSIGISLFPADGRDAQTLLKRADEAMYRAKPDRVSGAVFSA